MTEKQSSYTKQHRTLPPHIQAPLERALYINNHCCHLRMLRPHTAAARSSIHMPHHNVLCRSSHRGIYHTKPQSFQSRAWREGICVHEGVVVIVHPPHPCIIVSRCVRWARASTSTFEREGMEGRCLHP